MRLAFFAAFEALLFIQIGIHIALCLSYRQLTFLSLISRFWRTSVHVLVTTSLRTYRYFFCLFFEIGVTKLYNLINDGTLHSLVGVYLRGSEAPMSVEVPHGPLIFAVGVSLLDQIVLFVLIVANAL